MFVLGTSKSTRKGIMMSYQLKHSSMLFIAIPLIFGLAMVFLIILSTRSCSWMRNVSGEKREEIRETVSLKSDSPIWDNAGAADTVNDAIIPLSMEVQNLDANYTEHTSW